MSARLKVDHAPHERAHRESFGFEGGRSAHNHGGEERSFEGWRPPRSRATRDEDDHASRGQRPYTAQQHRDHRAHRAAADEARRHQAPHDNKHPHHPQQDDAANHSAARRPAAKQRNYAVSIAGHQVRFGPVVFWIVVGTLVIMAGWSIVTATYFAFHDDVITRLMSRQSEIEAAYEDRLADMRAQVDRITSRQLLDQEQFASKLEQIARRQSVLEQRASALGSLNEPVVTGSTGASGNGKQPLIRHVPGKEPKPSPLSELSAPATVPAGRGAHRETYLGLEGRLARLTTALDRVEQRQVSTLAGMQQKYENKVNHIRQVLAEIGVNAGKPSTRGVGGPFIPASMGSSAAAFADQVQRIQTARVQLDRLTKTLINVPVRQPVNGELDTSSTFGVRLDPFIRRPAMHTGIDFRGDIGDPVEVTANGRVVSAGWSGGYGRMIEIDHGNGLATRYGHLSQIGVQVGQSVRAGQVIGRIGSTGRSTGPHLHYETRVDGDAVDPQKFLRAGSRLGLL